MVAVMINEGTKMYPKGKDLIGSVWVDWAEGINGGPFIGLRLKNMAASDLMKAEKDPTSIEYCSYIKQFILNYRELDNGLAIATIWRPTKTERDSDEFRVFHCSDHTDAPAKDVVAFRTNVIVSCNHANVEFNLEGDQQVVPCRIADNEHYVDGGVTKKLLREMRGHFNNGTCYLHYCYNKKSVQEFLNVTVSLSKDRIVFPLTSKMRKRTSLVWV